jgi:hypothetical protein
MLARALKIVRTVLHFFLSTLVRRVRIARNSHDLLSSEITTVLQHSQCDPPDIELFQFISALCREYPSFDYRVVPNKGSIWDVYNVAYIGEHYRLLALITKLTRARRFLEVGTFRGASAAAILENTNATVISYDLKPASSYEDCYVSPDASSNGRFIQKIGDLYNEQFLQEFLEDFSLSDVVFLDGPKNYYFEKFLLKKLFESERENNIYLVLDDIRVSTMTDIWNSIEFPKADISFMGHWSGTGLVLLRG